MQVELNDGGVHSKRPLKLAIFGALGRVGKSLVPLAVEHGYEVVAVVRRPLDIEDAFSPEVVKQMSVRTADSFKSEDVAKALEGVDVAINVAGNINMGESFEELIKIFITQAEKSPVLKHVWFFAGLAALNFPESKVTGTDLPFIGRMFKGHRVNFDEIRRSSLNWTLVCPGPLTENTSIHLAKDLTISLDEMPIRQRAFLSWLPSPLLIFPFLSYLPQCTINYDDLSQVIIENLMDDKFSKRRMGIGLPEANKG